MCRKAEFEPISSSSFDSSLDGWALHAFMADGVTPPPEGTWAVASDGEQTSCGSGALKFSFDKLDPLATVYIERSFDMDTSKSFSFSFTYDFGTLDYAGAQGWTLESSARTAEAFDSPEGVKVSAHQSTGKDDSAPGFAFVSRGGWFNLEPSSSGKVWLRLGIKAGDTEAPRLRTYRIDNLQVAPPELRP